MSSPTDARRRWWGAFFLTLAAGLLIWGETVFKPHLRNKWVFTVYWLFCFILTALAIYTALLDLRAMRQRFRDQHRDLLDRTIHNTRVESEDDGQSTARPSDQERGQR
jgi:hypothetical protein